MLKGVWKRVIVWLMVLSIFVSSSGLQAFASETVILQENEPQVVVEETDSTDTVDETEEDIEEEPENKYSEEDGDDMPVDSDEPTDEEPEIESEDKESEETQEDGSLAEEEPSGDQQEDEESMKGEETEEGSEDENIEITDEVVWEEDLSVSENDIDVEKEIQRVQTENVGEAATETVIYDEVTDLKLACDDAPVVSGTTITFTLTKNVLVKKQIKISEVKYNGKNYDHVVLLAANDVTFTKGSKISANNMFNLNGKKLTIGSAEGMEGKITIDGGAIVTKEQSSDYYFWGDGVKYDYTNSGVVSEKGLFYLSANSELTLYDGVVLQNTAVTRKETGTADYFQNGCVIGNYNGTVTLSGCEITNNGYVAPASKDCCIALISNWGTSAKLIVEDAYIHDNIITGGSWQYDSASMYGDYKGAGIIANYMGNATITGETIIVEEAMGQTDTVTTSVAIFNAGTMVVEGDVVIGNEITSSDYYDYTVKGFKYGIVNSCGAFGNGKNYDKSTNVSLTINGGTINPGIVNFGKLTVNDGYIGCCVHEQNDMYETAPWVYGIRNYDSGKTTTAYGDYNANVTITGGLIAGEVLNEGYLEMTGGRIMHLEQGGYPNEGIDNFNSLDKKTKTVLSGGSISGFAVGVHAYYLGEVSITGDVIIANNSISGVEVEASNYRDYTAGDLDVIMTGGTIRGNGTYGDDFTGAVSLTGDGGRFILSGGTITENKGWDGCAINYYRNLYYKGLYPYVIIRGGLVTKNYSSSGYQAKYPFNGGFDNCSQVKDGTVFLAHDIMTFEGVDISDVFKGNYSYREEDATNDVVLTSYEDLIANFEPVETDGVKVVNLNKNITIKNTIVIPENEKVTLNVSKNMNITRSQEFTGDLFRVSDGSTLKVNENAKYTLIIDGGTGFEAKSVDAGVFYVEENASLELYSKVRFMNHKYVHDENAAQVSGALITNHGLCDISGVTIENNEIEQDAEKNTALIYNSSLGSVTITDSAFYSSCDPNYNIAINNEGKCTLDAGTTMSGFSLALIQDNKSATANISDTIIKNGEDAIRVSGGTVTFLGGASIQYLDNIGVTLSGSGHFILNGGEIQNCGYYAMTQAAAIWMTSDDAKLTVKKGTITSNEAINGAAIYRSGNGMVTFEGGSITGNYSSFDTGNKSGVNDGAFYADSAVNIVWKGVTVGKVFTKNYVGVIPSRFGTNKTIRTQQDFEKVFPIVTINGKRVRFLHDKISVGCELTVSREETWIPLNDTIIYKGSYEQSVIRVLDGGKLTLGDTTISNKTLAIDGQGEFGEYQPMKYLVSRGTSPVLAQDATLLYVDEGATLTVTDSVIVRNSISFTDEGNKKLTDAIVVGSAITNLGTLNLNGGLIAKNGVTYHMDRLRDNVPHDDDYPSLSGYMPCILNKGEKALLNLQGAIIEENVVGGAAVLANYGGKVVMTGGEITAYKKDGNYQKLVENAGEFHMQGGTITQVKYSQSDAYQGNPEVVFLNSQNMLLEGGTITGSLQNDNVIEDNPPIFTMKGGTLQSYNSDTLINRGNAVIEAGNIWIHGLRVKGASTPAIPKRTILYNESGTHKANLKVTGGDIAFKEGYKDVSKNPDAWPSGIYNYKAKVEVNNVTLSHCGDALYDCGESVLTNCVFKDNRTGIKVSGMDYDTSKTMLLAGCIVEDNRIGLEINGESNVYIEDGAIVRRNQKYGLDIQNGIVTMNGGQIRSNNDGTYERGGVRLRYGTPEFIMNGGQIRGNHGQDGAAIYATAGTVRLNGGQITKNYCDTYWGMTMQPGLADKTVYIDKENGAEIKFGENVKPEDIIFGNYYGAPKESSIQSAKKFLFMTPGQQASVNAVLYGDDELGYRVVSGSDIVLIDNNGIVTALKTGSAKILIQCLDSGASWETAVEVKDYFTETPTLSLGRGESQPLILMERNTVDGEEVVAPADATVEWSTDNEDIVSIIKDADGNYFVTGEGNGNAKIYAVVKKQHGKETGKLQVALTVTVTVAVREVSLNKTEAAMMVGDSQTLQAYVVPYDTDDEYTIQWKSSDEKVVSVKPNARGDMAIIQGAAAGTADITVQVLVDGEVRAENTCKASVTATSQITSPEPLHVLTNHSDRLSEVKLPAGYTWKEARKGEASGTKLKASTKPQKFMASYADDEKKVYGDVEVTLYVSTITGFEVSADTLLETGDKNKGTITLKPIYKGAITSKDLWGNGTSAGLVTFEHTVSGEGLLKVTGNENSPIVNTGKDTAIYYVEALEGACGRNVEVKITMALDNADTSDRREKGDLWFEKTLRIKVAEKGNSVAESITLDLDKLKEKGIALKADNSGTVLSLIADADTLQKMDFDLPVVVKNRAGDDVTKNTKIKYSSSKRNVATVSSKGAVSIRKAGITMITVTAGDGSNEKLKFYLDVRSYKPRLANDQLALNIDYANGAVSKLYLMSDSALVAESLGLSYYGEGTEGYVSAEDMFDIKLGANNEIRILAKDAFKENYQGPKTYSLILTAKVQVNGAEGEEAVIKDYGADNGAENGIPLKLQVVEQLPDVQVEQKEVMNLFYKNESGTLDFKVKGEVIEAVTLDDNDIFKVVSTDIAGGKASIALKVKEDVDVKEMNPKVECTFKITVEDYTESITLTKTVSTRYKKPIVVFANGSIYVVPNYEVPKEALLTGEDVLWDKENKELFNPEGMMITTGTEGVKVETGTESGNVVFTLDESFLEDTIDVTLQNDNWREDIELTEKVVRKLPEVTLSKQEIILSNTQDLAHSAPMETKLSMDASVYSLKVKSIEPADDKTESMVAKALLVARKDGASVLTGLQVINKKGVPQRAAKGTYSFRITPEVVITEGSEAIELKPVTLTVKVTEGVPTITLKGNNRFNLLDRSGSGIKEFRPVITNSSLTIKSVALKGSDADKFGYIYSNGTLKILPKAEESYELRRNYLLIPHYTMEDGSVIIGRSVTLTPYEPAIMVKSSQKSVEMYRGAWGKQNGVQLDLTALASGKTTAIASVKCKTPGFAYDMDSGSLYVSNPYILKDQNKKKVVLSVEAEGQATNSKRKTVTVTVKVTD